MLGAVDHDTVVTLGPARFAAVPVRVRGLARVNKQSECGPQRFSPVPVGPYVQARIQDSEGGGGGSYIQKGGFVQEFQERIQIVAGPWANQQAKIAYSRRGGGVPITPPPPPKKKKNLYPRMMCTWPGTCKQTE